MADIILGEHDNKEEIEKAFALMEKRFKESIQEKKIGECGNEYACELKEAILETPDEEFNVEDILDKYKNIKGSNHIKRNHLLQDMRIKGLQYNQLRRELEALNNYLQTLEDDW